MKMKMSKNSNDVVSFKVKSRAQRMAELPIEYPKVFCSEYEARSTEQVTENGRLVNKSTKKIVRPQDNFRGLNINDFALENIIAVGALDSLKECRLGSNTLSELSDSMEGVIDNVINAVNEAEVASVSQNDGGDE